ncbi:MULTISPECIES: BREX-2 system adenine-specific DNA-methyltransferase PglX [unclassified Nocardioides]|uniref:BREX-2 system adenine-specific DNA-methyltransferase PglX n=1 Tax=unclassified Nocardioides TaxID=2615069 RepID=UPI0006FBFC40|nr:MULTISPECIES: BREX-2 system adenine-specific DNA-methyltransferase PglX [unclassified Nocardioides]KRA37888.1 hypothetical protein ASD81_04175 [Nocardioides sp. Root614]KRA91848.1 hypothetical protein ASD84_04440 [Nocardioides sp. Root682]
MIQSAALLKDLKAQLKLVQADLRARADDQADRWGARLHEEYAEARKRERTGHSWVVWRDNEVDQAAVAWLIATTFVRFCEDNDLLNGARIIGQPVPIGWIAGPGDRTARAEENLTAYFRANPTHNRRDWLRQAFRVLAAQPAGKALVDEQHNPVWTADISAERASALIEFWRQTDGSGELVRDFTDPDLDTRFLGDLYQDLSDHARKTYALLQTPFFVEEFILDQTLTPALAEFGLNGIKLIDPTCGSGHFLLGAFQRLVDQWQTEAPALDAKERVRRAMDSIHGVDLNPFAIAIARFRLTVAGLLATGERSLVGVPNLGFHLAIGDSLLGEFGGAPEALQFEGEGAATYFYDGEDLKEYAGILKPGQYHVVVGNPPYITVKDKALNALYRMSYKTAAGKYALSAPFMELFFRLAVRGEQGQGAGFVGQITANSFMKREFGKKLVEEFFAGHHLGNPVDLSSVIDTSGAYIPGHGTPTVIIVGRRRRPVSDHVRAVLGVRGEPGQPNDPAYGLVWTEIAEHANDPGFVGTYVSVVDAERATFDVHPWSLTGGGAGAVMDLINGEAVARLSDRVFRIGFGCVIGSDDSFVMPRSFSERHGLGSSFRRLIVGDEVRDFSVDDDGEAAFYPYDDERAIRRIDSGSHELRWMWPQRDRLWRRPTFSKRTYRAEGRAWYEWHQFPKDVRAHKYVLGLAFVATHNHFTLDRSGAAVYNKTAPMIKLPATATDADHLGLLGVLSSSTACFWLRNMCLGKPLQGEEWQRRYEFDSTKLSQFPLPSILPAERGARLESLALELSSYSPKNVIDTAISEGAQDLRARLRDAERAWNQVRSRLVFEQEELDWQTYACYGLVDRDLTYSAAEHDSISLGQRAFEVLMARDVARGGESTAWFERHGSTAITELPKWPVSYRAVVEERMRVIESHPMVRLLERPEYKRRWMSSPWSARADAALRSAILDLLERPALWIDTHGPVARSVGELSDLVRAEPTLPMLLAAWTGDTEPDIGATLSALLKSEAVPYLAPLRLTESGVEKFRAWQQVWAEQRREDAGESLDVSSAPFYAKPDFRSADYWTWRGKLDMAKERFVLFPGLGREGDSSVVLGWAGWDHKEQALALAREFPMQDALGASNDLLSQMVAGLVELEPWLHQWHSEMDASFGVSPAEAISGVIDQQLGRLEATREEVTSWEPPAPTPGRRAKNS